MMKLGITIVLMVYLLCSCRATTTIVFGSDNEVNIKEEAKTRIDGDIKRIESDTIKVN